MNNTSPACPPQSNRLGAISSFRCSILLSSNSAQRLLEVAHGLLAGSEITLYFQIGRVRAPSLLSLILGQLGRCMQEPSLGALSSWQALVLFTSHHHHSRLPGGKLSPQQLQPCSPSHMSSPAPGAISSPQVQVPLAASTQPLLKDRVRAALPISSIEYYSPCSCDQLMAHTTHLKSEHYEQGRQVPHQLHANS